MTRDRLDGYREAAEAAGFAWDDLLIAVCAHNDVTEAEQIAAALLTSATPPDAIAAMSDNKRPGSSEPLAPSAASSPMIWP